MLGLPADFPQRRFGILTPRNQSDTAAYEFYKVVPSGAIVSFAQLGLTGFDGDAVDGCLAQNLERCVERLVKRDSEMILLSGIPIALYITPSRRAEFLRLAEAVPLGGVSSLDTCFAAFHHLCVEKIVVVNKWHDVLNDRLRAASRAHGLDIIGINTRSMAATALNGAFESGASLAISLVEDAMRQHPDAEAIWLAGGAWLVGSLVDSLEQHYGVPVISASQAAPWYFLDKAGSAALMAGRGRLLASTDRALLDAPLRERDIGGA